MAFTSRAGGQSGKRTRRDRNSIVGLSGWLFADLLLGLAVVFLVAAEKPPAEENSNACTQLAPNVVNHTVGAATEIITYFNFVPKVIAESGGAEPGVVYKQDPPSDVAVCSGTEITLTYEPLPDGIPTTGRISLDGTCTIVLKGAARTSLKPGEIATIFKNELVRLSKIQTATAESEACKTQFFDESGSPVVEIGFVLMTGDGDSGTKTADMARPKITQAFKQMGLISTLQDAEKFVTGAIRTYKNIGNSPSSNLKLEIFVLARGV